MYVLVSYACGANETDGHKNNYNMYASCCGDVGEPVSVNNITKGT